MTKVIKPSEKRELLKKRLEKIKGKFPKGIWINIFIQEYPDYSEHKSHVSNVFNGLSLDESVIESFEEIAPRMRKLTLEYLFN